MALRLIEHDFAQLEHINQVIYNNQHYEYWEVFDTKDLIEYLPSCGTYNKSDPKSSEVTSNVVDIRYNSIIVNINTTLYSDAYLYTFEVRNALWDGNYKIVHSKNEDSDDDILHEGTVQISKINENTIAVLIGGNKHKDVRVSFHYSNVGDGRTIHESSLIIKNENEYSDEYDKEVAHTGMIVNEYDKPVQGAIVSLTPCTSAGLETSEGFKEHLNVLSDSKGEYSLKYSEVNIPGTYYAKLTATYNNLVTTKIVKVDKYNDGLRGVNWGADSQYNNVYKGSIKTFDINIITLNKYGQYDKDDNKDEKLIGTRVTVTKYNPYTKTEEHQTCTIDSNNQIHPQISFRRYYDYRCILRVTMNRTDIYDYVSYEKTVTLVYAVASDYSHLKSLAENNNGPDWIMLNASTYNCNNTINIKRDITLMSLRGDNPTIIDANKNYTIFNITNPSSEKDNLLKFRLIGCTIKRGNPAIKYNKGTSLVIDRCIFIDNTNTSSKFKGGCIYANMTTDNIRNKNLLELHVKQSYFNNNIGNEITSMGYAYIEHNLFKTTSASCLKQPEPKVLNVVAGEVEYKYNKSYIDTGTTSLGTNHSFAKALAYVYKDARFNGKGPSQLGRDNSLPLFGQPYYNEAYTYCIYYYPYDNVKTTIVCSPVRGKERRATGHASSLKRWVFYDGYTFIRRSAGLGNRKNPWSEKELSIPGNMGVYDNVIGKFLLIDYDPHVSTYNNNITKVIADKW